MAGPVNIARRACSLLACQALLAGGAARAGDIAVDDPMRPSYLKPLRRSDGASHDGPRLQAVFGDADRRVAIVSGQVLVLGNRFGALTLTRIEPHAVELRDGQRIVFLTLTGRHGQAGGESP